MEASTLQPPASLPRPRVVLGAPLLRLRSDEQLVALFRAGHDEAFRAIHDRYYKRLFAYSRQMLPGRQDAEDALQDVFVRAYAGLRTSNRDLALRAWLFRVAHNRCIDELRKPAPPSPEVLHLVRSNTNDPVVEVDLRESLRRLVEDIRRLPDQQRSALLMRELGGMSYVELASSLDVSVGAVKSLLVRARLGLAQAAAARDTACSLIQEQLVEAHDHGIRPNANTRKHIRDCSGCRSFRRDLRGVSRQLGATAPTIGPLGFLAKLLGLSGGGSAAGGAGGGVALLGGGGTTVSAGGLALSTSHVATLVVAAVATAGGAVEIQHTFLPVARHVALVRPHPGFRHRAPAPLTMQAAPAAVQTTAPPVPAIESDPRVAPVGTTSSGPTPAKPAPAENATKDAAGRSVVGAGGAAKRHASSSSSSTTSTSTPTSGSASSSTCTAPATTSPTTAGGSSSPSSAGSPTSTAASPAVGASIAPAGPSASCDSGTAAPTGSAVAPTGTPTSGSSPAAGSTSSTPPSSGSPADASSPTAGPPPDGSSVATGG